MYVFSLLWTMALVCVVYDIDKLYNFCNKIEKFYIYSVGNQQIIFL